MVAEGRVFLTADSNIFALDEVSGRTIWDRDFYWSFDCDAVDLPALIVDDAVYFLAGDAIYSNDVSTGETVWSLQLGAAINSPPAEAQGFLYIASDGGQFYATDPSKAHYKPEEVVWAFDLIDRKLSHPVVSNGILYAQSSDGKLEAYNAAKGYLIWTFDLGDLTDQRSYTAVQNTVYVGASDGSVYAIATETPVVAEVKPATETTPVAEETPAPQGVVIVETIPGRVDVGFDS